MTALRVGIALLACAALAAAEEDAVLMQMKPKPSGSFAEDSEGIAAMKAGVVAKTKKLAKALESLTSDDTASMRKEFDEVFAMYKEDLEKDLPASAGIEKPGHGSFAHSSEGIAAMKAGVIEKTKKFAEALESLNTEDTDAMTADFDEVYALYKEDLEKDLPASAGTEKHGSFAHSSEGTAAIKAGVVAKTKKLAKALESLTSDDMASMRKDFEEVFALYKEDLEKDLPDGIGTDHERASSAKGHASLAEGATGLAARKASIVTKTKDFAEAMESLASDDMASLRKDFEGVFAMYKEDLEEDLPASTGTKKHGSLAHSSEGVAAMKAGVVAKVKKFREALESLDTEDTHALTADFEEVFKLFKDDLKTITERKPEEKEVPDEDEEEGKEKKGICCCCYASGPQRHTLSMKDAEKCGDITDCTTPGDIDSCSGLC